MITRRRVFFPLAAVGLLALAGCVEKARNAIPFLPQTNQVNRGGRLLTLAEAAYYQKLLDLRDAIKANPKDAVAHNTVGELFQKKGGYKIAKEYYYLALQRDDTLSQAHYNLGLICLCEDRCVEAREHLEKARALSPDDARIRHRLGLVKAGLGKSDEALTDYDDAIKLDPEYTPAYLDKALLFYKRHKYEEAERVCRAALKNVPKAELSETAKATRGALLDKLLPSAGGEEAPKTFRQEAAYDLALCLKAQGRFREALGMLVQAEDAETAKADTQLLKAWLLEASGDAAGATQVLEALRPVFPDMAEIPKRLARLYQKSGQGELAAKTRMAAAELDHSDRELQEEAARNAEQMKDTARMIAMYERLVRVAPDDLRYRRQLAKAYDDAGIARQAALAYQEVVNRDSSDMATRRRLGILYAKLPGFQGSAVLQFKRVLQEKPNDSEVHRKMGELALQTGNMREAEQHIRQTLAVSPQDAQAHNNLANLMVQQKQFEDAVRGYERALSIDPKMHLARLNLAKVLLGLGRREDAVAPLREYLAQNAQDAEARRLLADALRDLGRREEAGKEYEALYNLRPRDADAVMELARLNVGMGNQRAAAGIYESILEKHPSNADALREAARLYSGMNMQLRAIFCWQRLLALKPGDLEGQTRLAQSYKATGAEDAAIKSFEAVGRSGDADAWKNAAYLRLKRGERDLALQAYREAIKIKNMDTDARRQLAGLLQNSSEQACRDEALRLYQEMLQIDPKDQRARLNLANLLNDANRMAEAQDEYDTILREKPEDAAALTGLGVLWRKRGKFDAALKYYMRALAAKPDTSFLRTVHYNMAVIYDFYMADPVQAHRHYAEFLDNGGDPAKIPEDVKPAERIKTPAPAPAVENKAKP